MRGREILLAILAAGILLGVGIWIGRGVERTSAAVAEPSAPVLRISKNEAWECVARANGWRARSFHEDLAIPVQGSRFEVQR